MEAFALIVLFGLALLAWPVSKRVCVNAQPYFFI